MNGVGGKIGPDLGRLPRPRSFFDLAAAMWNHLPRMAERMRTLGIARPRLDAREAADLVAFLFTLDYFDPPGNADRGRRLFTGKRCIVCHQAGGAGGVVGPNLDFLKQQATPISLAAAMWNHGPQMAEVMKAKRIARPTFDDTELRDLIAYLGGDAAPAADEPLHVLPGRAEAGRRLFVDKRCVDCHRAGGPGGTLGPDLAERRLQRSLTGFAARMWNKAPAMLEAMRSRAIPVPQLRPGEMADILAYLYSVRYLATPGDPRKGEAVARAKGCLGCHALDGGGGKTAGDLARARGVDSPAGALAGLWNHAFLDEPRPARDRRPWAEMTGEETADLMAFLASR
ncbi:MAG TPA: cytochrome c, partial [Methylomirabilota bacterium]|nr:cytochrome c [Methylomirabilota bacterium]